MSYDNEISTTDIEENKAIAILCYFGLFLLIPYLTKPDSKFIKYHTNQGVILLLFGIICSAVLIVPLLGWIAGLIGYLFSFVCFIIGILNVLNGRCKPLPLIGKFTVLK